MSRRRPETKLRANGGFTLVELLVGLGLSAVISVLMLDLLAGTTRQQDTARRTAEARLMARPLLQQLADDLQACQSSIGKNKPYGLICEQREKQTILALTIPQTVLNAPARSGSVACVVYRFDAEQHKLIRAVYHPALMDATPVGKGLDKRTASIPALFSHSRRWYEDPRLIPVLEQAENHPVAKGVMVFEIKVLRHLSDSPRRGETNWFSTEEVPAAVHIHLGIAMDAAAVAQGEKDRVVSFQALLPVAGALKEAP